MHGKRTKKLEIINLKVPHKMTCSITFSWSIVRDHCHDTFWIHARIYKMQIRFFWLSRFYNMLFGAWLPCSLLNSSKMSYIFVRKIFIYGVSLLKSFLLIQLFNLYNLRLSRNSEILMRVCTVMITMMMTMMMTTTTTIITTIR